MFKKLTLATAAGYLLVFTLITLVLIPLVLPSLSQASRNVFTGVVDVVTAIVLLAVAYGAVLANQIPPLRPIAESSMLFHHLVGVTRAVLTLAGFFGGMVVTWAVTLDAGLNSAGKSTSPFEILELLGTLFLLLAPLLAYAYWMGIAIDLIRVGRLGRFRASSRLWRKIDRKLGRRASCRPKSIRARLRRASHSVALMPNWMLFVAHLIAPLVLMGLQPIVLATLRLAD